MAAKYGLFKNPPQSGDNGKAVYHPRIVAQGTKTTQDVAEVIADCSSFSSADTKGVLDALGKWIPFFLKQGYNVDMEGLGLFSISLQSQPVADPNDINAQSVSFKDVNFRTSLKLKRELRIISLEKSPRHAPSPFTLKQRKARIVEYIKQQRSISRSTCMQINMCNKNTAVDDLNELIEAKIIGRLGDGRMVLYVLLTKE